MKFGSLIAAAAMLGAASVSALAHDAKVGKIMIEAPWARVTLASRPAAGYMSVHNMGETADRIVAANSPMAEKIEMHTHLMEDGVMRMRQVEAIDLPAKGKTELKPGGLHLMIFGLKEQVKKGGMIPVKVTFETAGSVDLMLKVGQKGGAMGEGDHSKHGTSTE